MGQNAEREAEELRQETSVWKRVQQDYGSDLPFFHYSQAKIDFLEGELDRVTRLEKQNEDL